MGKNSTTKAHPAKTFGEHIAELRGRLFWIAGVFVLSSALAYSVRDPLIAIILAPLHGTKLVYLTPAGGFTFIFQITMYVGAVVTAPVLIYHLYKFVHPALPQRAKRYSLRIILASVGLMIFGVCFGYFVAVPAALTFLTTFASNFVTANLTADSYLNFIMAYVVGLGIIFQLPLLLIFWNWISPLPPGRLLKSQKFVIAGAFIAAAIITPTPDALNQSLVAGPIILIYQVGVVAVWLINRKRQQAEAVNPPEASTPPEPVSPAPKPVSPVPVKPATKRPAAPVLALDGMTANRPVKRPAQVERKKPEPARPLPKLSRPSPNSGRVALDGVSRIYG